MKGNTIILIGCSPQLVELLKNEWKNVVDEKVIFIGHPDQIPPVKEKDGKNHGPTQPNCTIPRFRQ